jgi:xanthine dehydrogenase small subunit
MENIRNQIEFYLNGIKQTVDHSHSTLTLSDYLRYEKCLTGTKIVCAEGDCGACTVLRYFPFPDEQSSFEPMNSCITPLLTIDGSSLVTVEALKLNDELHPVQTSMINCHGSQCGFCTPGFVMSLAGLVENKLVKKETTISKKEAKNWMTGNLCRCTGYEPIIHAALDIKLSECKSVKEKNLSSLVLANVIPK